MNANDSMDFTLSEDKDAYSVSYADIVGRLNHLELRMKIIESKVLQ